MALTGLVPGTYTLVVQDFYGCVQEFEVTILLLGACLLNYETDPGEPCTEVLILEVLFDGLPVAESNLQIEWADGNSSGLTRVVSTQTPGTYCVSISAPGYGTSCESLEHCFNLDAELCPSDDCKLFFTVNTDRFDECKKIINALVMKDGQLCEDDYEGYWEIECEPEVDIIEEAGDSLTYTIDLVNINDTNSHTIEYELNANQFAPNFYGRFIVKNSNEDILLDKIDTVSHDFIYLGLNTQNLTHGAGYIDSIKVRDTENNILYIPLSPSTAILTGSGGTANASDLIFDQSNPNKMRNALLIVTINFLESEGYSYLLNFNPMIKVFPTGKIEFMFVVKNEPSDLWLGIKNNDINISYHKNTLEESTNFIKYVSYRKKVFYQFYETSCGSISYITKLFTNQIVIDFVSIDFNKIILLNNVGVILAIDENSSNLSRTCSGTILRAVPKNCIGEATYLWDNGATTEAILNDGLTHTVEVECECEGSNETYIGMQREVYADKDREYCVTVFGLNTGKIYEGCIFVPGEPGCENRKECELTAQTSNGEPCTEVLNLEVLFDGNTINESDLEINWEDGNNSGLTRIVSTQSNGTYCVTISATNLDGNCRSLEYCFEVVADPACSRGLGRSSYTELRMNIEKNAVSNSDAYTRNNLNVHPNPFHDLLKVNFESYQEGEVNLAIYSITGQELFNRIVNCNQGVNIYTFNSKDVLTSGVMLLQVTFPSGQKMTQRIIRIDKN